MPQNLAAVTMIAEDIGETLRIALSLDHDRLPCSGPPLSRLQCLLTLNQKSAPLPDSLTFSLI
jgi:hypothetical protein